MQLPVQQLQQDLNKVLRYSADQQSGFVTNQSVSSTRASVAAQITNACTLDMPGKNARDEDVEIGGLCCQHSHLQDKIG